VKKIDLENHFVSQVWVDAMTANQDGYPRLVQAEGEMPRLYYSPLAWQPFRVWKLADVDGERLKAMDEAGVAVAAISLVAPGSEPFEPGLGTRIAKQSNDELAEAISRHPDRYKGYASLAPKEPETAVKELERCVKELGFVGWNTFCNFGDAYLDEKRFWPILGKAEELEIPIYLHPTVPMIPQFHTYGQGVAGASFGFGAETALVMMRMIVSGVFDVFPNLKIILGHYGEGLPFLLDRVSRPYVEGHVLTDPSVAPELKRLPGDYLRDNMVVTTSGNYLNEAFICTKSALGMDKITLGTDYPFGNMSECVAFLDGQGLSEAEREQLYEGNAARLGITG
jgi:predicted TIM-barrel fold metal-dependent hydrolase